MSENLRGRKAPTPPPAYPGNADTFAGVHAWNAPLKAIGVDKVPAPVVAALPVEQHPAVVAHLKRLEKKGVQEFDEISTVLRDLLQARAAAERSAYNREQSKC